MTIRVLYKPVMWLLASATLFGFLLHAIRLTGLWRLDTATLRWKLAGYQTLDVNTASDLNSTTLTNATCYAMTFVSICPERLYGNHRAGNQMFVLASLLHVAKVTGRTLVMPRKDWYLDRMFEIDVPRFDDYEQICPCFALDSPHYSYDTRLDDPKFVSALSKTQGSILLCGLSQTYQYAARNEQELRRMLRFPTNVFAYTENFPFGLGDPNIIKVGVHVRRGDFLDDSNYGFGLTTATNEYFEKAFKYFLDRYAHVQFVIASEDRDWSLANLPLPSSRSFLTFTGVNNTAGQDLAILSKCDGVIMSTGSFGWWAAWLANKTTIYYSEWPRIGSGFEGVMDKKNYFPPNWTPI